MTRKITKTGNAWAIVTIEDLEGAIDVLLFPSDYQLASTLLVEDTVVAIQGRLDKGKDQPELRGKAVSTPVMEDRGVGPVLITLPSTRCTPPVVEQLKEVLRTHPGTTEVRLRWSPAGDPGAQARRPAAGACLPGALRRPQAPPRARGAWDEPTPPLRVRPAPASRRARRCGRPDRPRRRRRVVPASPGSSAACCGGS